jgi:hypothetical protein
MTVRQTYDGSSGDATKALYARLDTLGPAGIVALNLFRAQKCSSRAKEYRRGAWKRDAYDRKNWSLSLLCATLTQHARELNIHWGWKLDPAAAGAGPHCWVLYVDLVAPTKCEVVPGIGLCDECSQPKRPQEFDGYGHMICADCRNRLGQVSFHSGSRGQGPDYPGEWDRSHASAQRIVNYCEDLLGEPRTRFPVTPPPPTVAAMFGLGFDFGLFIRVVLAGVCSSCVADIKGLQRLDIGRFILLKPGVKGRSKIWMQRGSEGGDFDVRALGLHLEKFFNQNF